MDSIYGKDPAEYWVEVTYDSGRKERHSNLNLNDAYHIACELENKKKSQGNVWIYERTTEHIVHVEAGRDEVVSERKRA